MAQLNLLQPLVCNALEAVEMKLSKFYVKWSASQKG